MWLILIIVLLITLYWLLNKTYQHWKIRGIPYVEPVPIFGNFSQYALGRKSMMSSLHDLYKMKDERIFGFYQFLKPALMVKDLDLLRKILIKDFDHFVDHKNFFSETDEPVFSKNLFSSTGQDWKELRSTLSPAFTGSKMRAMFILMKDCAERFTNHLAQVSKEKRTNIITEQMKKIYLKFTIDVIATCAYGIEANSLKDENNEFYKEGVDVSNFGGIRALKGIGFMIMPGIMRALGMRYYSEDNINFFRDIISKTIDYREKHNIIRPDLIHLMMEARKGKLKYEETDKDNTGFATVEESSIGKTGNSKLEITNDIIVAQAMIFFLGGGETVATLLMLTSYELALNIDVQRKLQAEIESVAQNNKNNVTYEQIVSMKYLDMVVSETLRLWPIAYMIDRYCGKDYTVEPTRPNEKSVVIEKGTSIFVSVIGIHRDPKYYPNPDKFDPERFNDENKHKIDPMSYMPFGNGPRNCIGNRFALLAAKVFLYHFLQKFEIVPVEKTKIPVQFVKKDIILNPVDGMWLGFKVRN